jgi:hypothetical protein
MADADRRLEAEGVDGFEDVSPEPDPVEVQARRDAGLTLAAQIRCEAVQAVRKRTRERPEHAAVETCWVGEQGGRAVAAEIVQRDDDAVRSRGS